jgi:hypothetical protein
MREWVPDKTRSHYGPPPVGRLVALGHAVWEVIEIRETPPDDDDKAAWMRAGMPDMETWKGRQHIVRFAYVGGERPAWVRDTPRGREAGITVRAVPFGGAGGWDMYPESNRWPQCSCCGEPMPCRAELQDRAVAASAKHLDELTAKLPGCCWGCGEPITARQRVVEYPGDNLDLPGAPPARFHQRRGCWSAAVRYEERWLEADPRHERILTYPSCEGTLIVHADGSSECRDVPGCGGHFTHDHGTASACYCAGRFTCTRGCSVDGHPGCRTSPRPPRTSFNQPALGERT